MKRLRNRLTVVASLVRGGQLALVAAKLRRALWSERRFIGFRLDLRTAAATPASPVKFDLRPMEPGDVGLLAGKPVSAEDAETRALMRSWIEGGLPGGYVAVLADGSPCYMQWLLRAADNDSIRAFFGNSLPQLHDGTVLLEGAYTPPRYRRMPIMPAAMARIAALDREAGATRAIVFVSEDNASMIKATEWAGFVPEQIQTERRRMFRSFVTYSALPRRTKVSAQPVTA